MVDPAISCRGRSWSAELGLIRRLCQVCKIELCKASKTQTWSMTLQFETQTFDVAKTVWIETATRICRARQARGKNPHSSLSLSFFLSMALALRVSFPRVSVWFFVPWCISNLQGNGRNESTLVNLCTTHLAWPVPPCDSCSYCMNQQFMYQTNFPRDRWPHFSTLWPCWRQISIPLMTIEKRQIRFQSHFRALIARYRADKRNDN